MPVLVLRRLQEGHRGRIPSRERRCRRRSGRTGGWPGRCVRSAPSRTAAGGADSPSTRSTGTASWCGGVVRDRGAGDIRVRGTADRVVPDGAVHAVVGVKPPWNQPQVTLRAFSRSPMFCARMANEAAWTVRCCPSSRRTRGRGRRSRCQRRRRCRRRPAARSASAGYRCSGRTRRRRRSGRRSDSSAPGVEGPKVSRGVVAQREVLGVVPQGGDGVAVEVVHRQARRRRTGPCPLSVPVYCTKRSILPPSNGLLLGV